MGDQDPAVTQLVSQPLVITEEDRAKAFWLIQKYTSITYMRHLERVYAQFVQGYEQYARRDTEAVGWQRETLKQFYDYSAKLNIGTDRVARGHPIGYESISRGCLLEWYIDGRRFSETNVHEEIGRRLDGPSVGLYPWAEVAVRMARNVGRSLGIHGAGWNSDPLGKESWAFPSILDPRTRPEEGLHEETFPVVMPAQPPPSGGLVATDEEIPTSGIWLPVELVPEEDSQAGPETRPQHPNWGCPAYLWAGRLAPPATYAYEQSYYSEGYPYKLDYPANLAKDQLHVVYTYRKLLVRWQPLWEDRRYDSGREPGPEEASFLDPSTQPPPGPARG